MAQETGDPIISDSISADWTNGNSRDGNYNKRRVDVTNKATATDINEMRAMIEFMAEHTHSIPEPPSATYNIRHSGYYIFEGGLVMQWGFIKNDGPSGTYTRSFPISFPNTNFIIVGGFNQTQSVGHESDDDTVAFHATSSSQFSVILDNGIDVAYIALGH